MQTTDLHILRITRENKVSVPKEMQSALESHTQEHEFSPVWQTFWWTQVLVDTGYIDTGFCVYSENYSFIAFLQKRSLGMGQYGLFCLGGPITITSYQLPVTSEKSSSLDKGGVPMQSGRGIFSETLEQLCEDEGCLLLQVEELQEFGILNFEFGIPYKKFIEPVTALIDLTQSEEEILANMKQKGRYNIKTAQKHEVKVEKSEPVQNAKQQNIHEPVHDFYELLQETTQRNHFAQNNFEYYQKLVQSLEEYDLGGLYVAKKDDEIIAAAIFVYYGNVGTYYYGASTSDNAKRKYMASYLLQWEAIKEAKKRGCQWFDFLGVADESGKPEHLAGVTDFKMKFGPEVRRWPEVQMYVPNKTKYQLLLCVRRLKLSFTNFIDFHKHGKLNAILHIAGFLLLFWALWTKNILLGILSFPVIEFGHVYNHMKGIQPYNFQWKKELGRLSAFIVFCVFVWGIFHLLR